MKRTVVVICFYFVILNIMKAQNQPFGIVIHGGAGSYNETQNYEKHIKKLEEAVDLGYDILERGGTSLEAIEAVIVVLENSPLFNAGKGSVTNEAGDFELDASIMDGREQRAGAVAGLKCIQNPIKAAKFVMEKTPHVLIAGNGAEQLLLQNGFKKVEKKYFMSDASKLQSHESKYGTVGAVALDKYGNLAAGTSTGGMQGKKPGRIGDSPLIGAGTYADNQYAAVSCTGHGEYFIRNVIAYDVIALMKYKNWSLQEATSYLINEKLKKQNGAGGLIAIDKDANISTPFNTTMMFRAYKTSKGQFGVFVK
jgi:beta-aspartyl-peptidase (threonine type)